MFKNFLGLTRMYRKIKYPPQNKTQFKKIENPPSFDLFTFIVLLLIDINVVAIIILFFCSKKWSLSYAPSCPQNIEIKLPTNSNGIATRVITSLFLIEIRIEHGSWEPPLF
jgi:hypothetical protein